jgi:hypothetical protein
MRRWRQSLPTPALGEGDHRVLARRGVAVGRRAASLCQKASVHIHGVTIDHALTDHNLLGAALGDVTPQSARAGHGDPDDIEPYARARMSWRTPVFDNSKGQTLSDCFCCELVPGRLPLGCANDACGAHTPAQGHYLASKSRGLRSEQMISRSGSLIIRRT